MDKQALEAVLFAAGDSVSLAQLCEVFGLSQEDCRNKLQEIVTEYSTENRGLQIIRLGNAYQLCTRAEHQGDIQKLVAPKTRANLTPSALETLSIIAYNQPVTRSGIEYIRGVNSDYAVEKLVEKGLVIDCGRLDSQGKPLLYRTTDEFLRSFGLQSLAELPDIGNVPLQLSMKG